MPNTSQPFQEAPRRGVRPFEPTEVVRSRAQLSGVLQAGENIRQLRRPLPASLREALAGVEDLPALETKRRLSSTADVAWLTELLDSTMAAALLPDFECWFAELQGLVGAARPIEGCLVVTRHDDCRKYHVDWVRLRLIVTYWGAGTEWVRNVGVKREALSKEWSSVSQINREIVPDPRHVHQAQPGDVLLLKGETYPQNAGNGAVHRSPPIALKGTARLVFKLTVLESPRIREQGSRWASRQ